MTKEFKLRHDQHKDPLKCDNCDFFTETTEYEARRDEQVLLCEVCYMSFLSHATTYPGHAGTDELLKSIGHATNRILQEIREPRESTTETVASMLRQMIGDGRLDPETSAREIVELVFKPLINPVINSGNVP